MAAKNTPITEKKTVVKLENPSEIKTFAKELTQFINDTGLAMIIGSGSEAKKYVLVEGWQFAGAAMGLYPIPTKIEKIEEEGEVKYTTKRGYEVKNPIYKYKVYVDIVRIADDKVVGRGVALCSNQEAKKRTFDEFAILSMAQTRAVGKGFRLTIGWVMKFAGFEGTPAEEAEVTDIPEAEVTEDDAPALPIEVVKEYVDKYVQNIPNPTDGMRFVKDAIGTVKKVFTDAQYYQLYDALPEENKHKELNGDKDE